MSIVCICAECHCVSLFPEMLVRKNCQKLKQFNGLILRRSNYCLLQVLLLKSLCFVSRVGAVLACCSEQYSLCVNVWTLATYNTDHNLCVLVKQILDVAALQVCLESLSPSTQSLLNPELRRAWCDKVLSIRPAVEDMMRKERFGPGKEMNSNYGEKSTVLLGRCR